MITDDLHHLTGAYALDALDAEDAAEFEAHLATCPVCPGEVRELQIVAGRLAQAEAVTPPPGFADAVMAQVAVTRQLTPLPAEEPASAGAAEDTATDTAPGGASVTSIASSRASGRESRRATARAASSARRWRRISAGLAVAACFLAVAVVGLGLRGQQLADERDQVSAQAAEVARVLSAPDVTTTPTEAGDGEATVLASESTGKVLVVANGLEAQPSDRTYQLWFIDSAGTPRSAGTFDPQADGEATVLLQGESRPGDTIGLSVEPDGGSQAPTTTPLFAVPLPA